MESGTDFDVSNIFLISYRKAYINKLLIDLVGLIEITSWGVTKRQHENFDKEQANEILEIIREKILTQKESSVVSGL